MIRLHSNSARSKYIRWALLCLALTVGLIGINLVVAAESSTPFASTIEIRGSPQRATTFPFVASPIVSQIMREVQPSALYSYTGYLSGEFPVSVGGQSRVLTTRNMYSPHISSATQYVSEFMQARGLFVSYFNWSDPVADLSGRNVIGVITGTVRPNEIVLITAHLDNLPENSAAPGADDNASGSAAVLMAAARLAGHRFERTLRFVFLTGEEYGLLGSQAYAQDCIAKRENIVAVFNLDMIGWDDNQDGDLYLETRRVSHPGYAADLAIASVFTQVVQTYGLRPALHPRIDANSDPDVDSWAFWNVGIPSITAIEDFSGLEMNPYYHTTTDKLATLNQTFFTNFVKAAVGTAAHLAIPVENKMYLPLILEYLRQFSFLPFQTQ